jgi:hypothetical protein
VKRRRIARVADENLPAAESIDVGGRPPPPGQPPGCCRDERAVIGDVDQVRALQGADGQADGDRAEREHRDLDRLASDADVARLPEYHGMAEHRAGSRRSNLPERVPPRYRCAHAPPRLTLP